jgi:hypothetical protein
MRYAIGLVVAFAVVAAGWAKWTPPRSKEIDRVLAVAEAEHRASKAWNQILQQEFRRHAWDAHESIERRARAYGIPASVLFRIYAAIAFVEARWRVKESHDNGDGWGTIGLQEGGVMAAAQRLGILRKNAPQSERAKLWNRFHRDPAFTVLIGVDHVAWIVVGKPDILPGIVRHNCRRCDEMAWRAERYGGSVLYWYRLLWRENLPFSIATKDSPAVGFGPQ